MKDHDHCSGAGHGGHTHGLNCRELGDFLLAYVEGELKGEAVVEFERHLRLCPPCLHYLDGYRETVELVRSCGRSEAECGAAPQAPPEALIRAILAATATCPDK